MLHETTNHTQPLIHRLDLEVVGGVEVSFLQYAQYRQALGAKDTVIIGDDVHPRFQTAVNPPMRAISRRQFRQWHGLRIPKFARGLRAHCAAAQAVRGDERAIISWDSIGSRETVDLARASGLPLIHFERGQAWEPGTARTRREFLDGTRGVIANSKATGRILALRWGWAGPTAQVYPMVTHVLPTSAARRHAPSSRPLWLGCAGRLVETKGFLIALHALKLLRDTYHLDARLAIAGSGAMETALKARANKLNLQASIVFKGPVADMAGFYDAMDIQLVPSLFEPFGRVSIEAQARGCPVVVAAANGLPETLAPDMPESTAVTPRLSLAEYASELGGNPDALWPWMYDPASDSLTQPQATAPADLAQAVATLLDCDADYHLASKAGLDNVHDRFMGADSGPIIDTAISQLLESSK